MTASQFLLGAGPVRAALHLLAASIHNPATVKNPRSARALGALVLLCPEFNVGAGFQYIQVKPASVNFVTCR